MRYATLGARIRRHRDETGMSSDDMAERLSISRAALYRYERGAIVKIEILRRLADMLGTTTAELLGCGIETYADPIAFLERTYEIETTATRIVQIGGATCQMATDHSEAEVVEAVLTHLARSEPEPTAATGTAYRLASMFEARRQGYQAWRPTIVVALSRRDVASYLRSGLFADEALPDELRRRCRRNALVQIDALATAMAEQPMDARIGLMASEPFSTFVIARDESGASLTTNAFGLAERGPAQRTLPMVISDAAAVGAHEAAASSIWRDAHTGRSGSDMLRAMMADAATE